MRSSDKTAVIAILVTAAVVVPLLFMYAMQEHPAISASPSFAKPEPATAIEPPDQTAEIADLREELATLREEVYRHRKALKGISYYMDLAEEIAKFGPIARQAEETTGNGVRNFLGEDPPDLHKKQSH